MARSKMNEQVQSLGLATRRGPLRVSWTPIGLWSLELPETGVLGTVEDPRRLALPQWLRLLVPRLEAYFEGAAVEFRDVPIDFRGYSDFTRQVLEETRHLTYGETCFYKDLAARIARPKAVRAVGRALGSNRTPLVIPCHRVLSASGLGGFSSKCGVATKRVLLDLEGALPGGFESAASW